MNKINNNPLEKFLNCGWQQQLLTFSELVSNAPVIANVNLTGILNYSYDQSTYFVLNVFVGLILINNVFNGFSPHPNIIILLTFFKQCQFY